MGLQRQVLIAMYTAFIEVHSYTAPVVGVGKERCTLIGPWGYLKRKLSFIELP